MSKLQEMAMQHRLQDLIREGLGLGEVPLSRDMARFMSEKTIQAIDIGEKSNHYYVRIFWGRNEEKVLEGGAKANRFVPKPGAINPYVHELDWMCVDLNGVTAVAKQVVDGFVKGVKAWEEETPAAEQAVPGYLTAEDKRAEREKYTIGADPAVPGGDSSVMNGVLIGRTEDGREIRDFGVQGAPDDQVKEQPQTAIDETVK